LGGKRKGPEATPHDPKSRKKGVEQKGEENKPISRTKKGDGPCHLSGKIIRRKKTTPRRTTRGGGGGVQRTFFVRGRENPGIRMNGENLIDLCKRGGGNREKR